MGRVIHFEFFSDDAAREAEFYRSVFGWDVQSWEAMPEYRLVGTGPDTEAGINGAISTPGTAGDQAVVLTVAVDDLDAAIARAQAAGAEPVGEKGEIEGIGLHTYMRDPAGTVFGMLQPAEMPAMAPAGQPAEESATRDVWEDFGDSLRQLGDTVSKAFTEAAASPQAKRAREEAQRAASGIRDASVTAGDRARPHVITALDRVSVELGNLASRLRRDEAGGDQTTEEHADEPPASPPADESGTPPEES